MLKFSKKLQRQDQGVGLVFRWRAARRYHEGKIFAFSITVGVFVMGAYLFKIDGVRSGFVSKRTGEVLILNEDDPNGPRLLSQVEDRSPFPARWDPAYDAATMGRVDEAIFKLEGKMWDYEPEMVRLSGVPQWGRLSSISSDVGRLFDDSSHEWSEILKNGRTRSEPSRENLMIQASIVADESLRDRLPVSIFLLPHDLIADEWFGDSFRFLVGIDASGVVRGCLPLAGGSLEVVKPSEKQKFLSAWLRRTPFKAVDGDMKSMVSIGVLEIQIQARKK